MEEPVSEALFDRFNDLDSSDPHMYSSALLFTRTLAQIRKDRVAMDKLEELAEHIPPTNMNLWSLQTIYNSLIYSGSGLLNSKIKLNGIFFSAIQMGECLNNFYELLFGVFMALYFQEEIDWEIEEDYVEKQESIVRSDKPS